MPRKVLKFTGINRNANEFQNSGACEELINLRMKADSNHVAVRPKAAYRDAESYLQFFEHSFGAVNNKVIIKSGGIVAWVNPDTDQDEEIVHLSSDVDVTISSAGNVLLICYGEDRQHLVFKFADGKYEKYDVVFPQITSASFDISGYKEYTVGVDAATEGAFISAVQKAASGFGEVYYGGACGMAVVGCTYELEDGQEIWSTAFTILNATKAPDLSLANLTATVYGRESVVFNLKLDATKSKGVKKINIYASRPVFQYRVSVSTPPGSSVQTASSYLMSSEELNLGGELMYYQGSILPNKKEIRFYLNFSKSNTVSTLMPVTTGCVERTGDAISYNNRFHLYNSSMSHVVQVPTVSREAGDRDTGSKWFAYIEYEGKWILTKYYGKLYNNIATSGNSFAYPMSGVTRMAFIKGDQWLYFGDNDMFYVEMNDSTSYNYSCAVNVFPEIISARDFYDELVSSGTMTPNGANVDTPKEKIALKSEYNTINVSAPFNPLVFPVDYSYAFGGNILDIATAYTPISAVQAGQYPLTIFTTNGIYGLQQGDGNVLYSNVVPLLPNVIEGRAKTTPYGTFFVSSKNIHMLIGREAINVSYVMNGNIEEGIRSVDSYKRLCCGTGGLYDFSDYLSKVDFDDFISNTVLNYDQLNNEVIISGSGDNLPYSYVFNIDTKTYHKVNVRYLPSQNGARYLIEANSNKVVDMFTEVKDETVPVLLQSRPMPLEVFYTHIQRLHMLVDTKLEDGQNLCLSVFGSNNLYDWRCIISAQKRDTVLRQITTNRAAKSYKDYVILINGTVNSNTDLSEIIADYSVISRRLG